MESLHSKSSFLIKWISLFWIIIGLSGFVLALYHELWVPSIFVFCVVIMFTGIARNFHFDLKKVYLDEANCQIIVKNKGTDTRIDFDDIKYVRLTNIMKTPFLVIGFKKDFDFGNELTFAPRDSSQYYNSTESRLKKILQNYRSR